MEKYLKVGKDLALAMHALLRRGETNPDQVGPDALDTIVRPRIPI